MIEARRLIGWTVRTKTKPWRYLRIGWGLTVDPEARWVDRTLATFDIGMLGSIVCYELEQNAIAAAEAVDGHVVKVWTVGP